MQATGASPPLRHLVSINDLTDPEIETLFQQARDYLDRLHDPAMPYRIGRSVENASGSILASLFYEPSTRTRLSFESAMLRLGGGIITSADPHTSSAAKGESLADSVRVVSNYADAIVIRHPRDGAARLASEYATIPIINGGDGKHEHPTQTLCDLFTLIVENGTLRGLNVVISGDLHGSRTIHSFVYALARFGANIMLMPAEGMALPDHVDRRLREEFGCVTVPRARYEADNDSIDVLYTTPEQPHQLSLISGADIDPAADVKLRSQVDAVYITRFQKERWAEKDKTYLKIDRKFLGDPKYAKTSVLHPLPRVGELDIALDQDPRAVYFRQAAYGVPVRMALIAQLLGLPSGQTLARYGGGFAEGGGFVYQRPTDVGLRCTNANCIVHDEMERQYTANKFVVSRDENQHIHRLRCLYCESDIDDFVIGDARDRRILTTADSQASVSDECLRDSVFFASEADAKAHDFA